MFFELTYSSSRIITLQFLIDSFSLYTIICFLIFLKNKAETSQFVHVYSLSPVYTLMCTLSRPDVEQKNHTGYIYMGFLRYVFSCELLCILMRALSELE